MTTSQTSQNCKKYDKKKYRALLNLSPTSFDCLINKDENLATHPNAIAIVIYSTQKISPRDDP
jgi:hypothetical protein